MEAIDFLYLKEKQFSMKRLAWHLDGMKLPLEMIGRKRISMITTQDLAAVLRGQLSKKVKTITAKNRTKILFTVIRWAKRRGFLKQLPEFPELPEAHYKPIEIPTMEEVQAMIRVAPPHLQRVIIITTSTGIRVGPSELFKLQWKDVDLRRRVICVKAAQKNPREPVREVPIRDDLVDLFCYWHDEDVRRNISWIISYKGHPVESVKRSWTQCLRMAGITRSITPYCLRHLFATEALAAGSDLGTVSKLLGHNSSDMVLEHYQHVLTKQKKMAVEALPRLDVTSCMYGHVCMDKKNGLPLQ